MFQTLWQYILKPALILMGLIIFFKVVFLVSNWTYIEGESWSEIFQVFTNSSSLDLAVLSYLLLIPTCLFSLKLFLKKSTWIPKFLVSYYALVSLLIFAINIIDINLFSYWSSKLSAKALSYLNTPSMAIASAGKIKVLIFVIALILAIIIFKFLFQYLIKEKDIQSNKLLLKLLLPLILFGLLILGLRGGLRTIPINQSEAYFSSNHVLNVAGVNSLWNAGNVLFQNPNSLTENPYRTMSSEKAEELFYLAYGQPILPTESAFYLSRPNIVFITMEGVNANCIKEFNSNNDYMPYVSSLMNDGYSFMEMYASGMRTDQGLVAVLSGFPALPLHTIGAQPEKFQFLPSLSSSLKEEGYQNTFFFAGEPEFGSFKAFLIHHGFDKVYSDKDFNKEQLTQDLGAPDEHLFNKFLEDMQNPKEPFFSMLLTQTTHEPFDMPFNDEVKDDAQKYINTVKYLDKEIGKWYEACKELPWFENTIFILSSDHSHTFPDRYWYTDKERFHIPFILFGPALRPEVKGKQNRQIVNQTDIPKSIANQLDLIKMHYPFSKEMFNVNSPQFSSFIHIHGHNWIDLNGQCSVNYEIENDFNNTEGVDSCSLLNAAYFQYVFETYMSY